VALLRLTIPKVRKKYLYGILATAAAATIVRLTPSATTMLILMIAFMLALLFLAIFVVTRRKGGNDPRSGPQHPLPVTSRLETRKTKHSS
jgi:hypothetical protein